MTRSTSGSLFDDGFDKNYSLVEVLSHGKPSTLAQRHFQRLVAKIERTREQLKQWQTYALRYNHRVSGEVEPLRSQLRLGQRQMVTLIDELLSQTASARRLGRVQRAKLHQILTDLFAALPQDSADEALGTLRDKYRENPQECVGQPEREMQLTRSILRDIFDLDVGEEDGACNAEELLQHAQRKMQERVETQARRAQAKQQKRAAKRSKTGAAEPDAAQAGRDQAAKEVSQSLREIYRKLVSALHPDREPDAAARQRKTLLMQRVNQAYDGNDLLTLLSLQLEIEQIDAAHLSCVPPQRLTHYIQILREQLAGLESELERHVEPFRLMLGRESNRSLTASAVDEQLSADIAQLRMAVRALQEDLVAFRDPRRLRERLRHYELEQDFDDADALATLIDIFQPPAPHGWSRR